MKNLSTFLAGVSIASLLALTAPALHAQAWNFNSNAQGWLVNDLAGVGDYTTTFGTSAPVWNSTGGNPGGYISSFDPSSNTFFFQAPTAQLGNYSSFVGGNLNFSLITDLSVDYTADSVIVFKGGLSNLTLVSAIPGLPTSSWSNFSLGLNAGAFRYNNLSGAVVTVLDFADVLGSLNAFLINGEFHNGVQETTGLDSVSFIARQSNTAVPEPSTYGLVGAAVLAGLVALRRRSLAKTA